MVIIPLKIKDGLYRDSIGSLVPGGVSAMAGMQYYGSALHDKNEGVSKAFRAYCIRELSKTPGGLDGLILGPEGRYQSEKHSEVSV